MIYILDTNVFREFFFHRPKKGKYFESVWNAFEQGIEKGTLFENLPADYCCSLCEAPKSSFIPLIEASV